MSKEAAPRISLCKAMRLRSRTTICSTGSSPINFKRMHAARLHRRQTEVWLSVMLMASTWFLISSALWTMCAASLPRGGPHSDVTARWPARSIFSNLLGVFGFMIADPP